MASFQWKKKINYIWGVLNSVYSLKNAVKTKEPEIHQMPVSGGGTCCNNRET